MEKGCGPVPCSTCTSNRTCLDAFGVKKVQPSREERAKLVGKNYTPTNQMIDNILDHGFRTQVSEFAWENKETGRRGIRTRVEYYIPEGGTFQLDDPISPYPTNTTHWEPSCSVCTFGVSGRCSLKVQKSEVIWIEMEEDPERGLNDNLLQMPDDVFSWMSSVKHENRHCILTDGSECPDAKSCTDFLWRSKYWKASGVWDIACPHTDIAMVTAVLQENRYIAKEVQKLAIDERRICTECDQKCELREKMYENVLSSVVDRVALANPDNWPTCPWDTAPKREFQSLWRSDVKSSAEVSANGTCKRFIHIKISQRRTTSFGQPFNAFRDFAWFIDWLDGQTSVTRRIELLTRVLSGLESKLRPTKVPTKDGGEELALIKRPAFSYIPYDQPFIPDVGKRQSVIASVLAELGDECKSRLNILLGKNSRKKILDKIETMLIAIARKRE